MISKTSEANLAMVVSKTFSGLNVNALRYLLPLWIAPLTGVTYRCVFAAVAFWIIGYWAKPEKASVKDKLFLLRIHVYLPDGTEQDDPYLCGDFHLHATDLGFPLIGTLSPRENNDYEDHRNFSWVKRSAIMYFDTKK